MSNSQQNRNQEVQNDKYSNLTPKQKPEIENRDDITNPDPEKKPGIQPDSTPTPAPPGNPSQFPERHPDEVPINEPNEVPMGNPDGIPHNPNL